MSELIVYLAGERIGRLRLKANGNMQFRYDEGYAGPRVSQAMPVQAEAHPHAACRAVFGGLLVEGDARETVARNLGISAGNDYGLLAELGGDCAGAITLTPPGADIPTEPRSQALSAEELEQTIHNLPALPLGANPERGTRLSLAGAQPKLPVIVDDEGISLPLNSAAATTHIIKPEPAAFPGLVAIEAFCMELARNVGLAVASVEEHQTQSGLPYLLVERYDRDLTTDPIRRLHQEDFCQALGRPSDRKYQEEGGPSVKEAVSLLREASAVPARDLPTIWRALVFNWLIGNCDAHGKNYSLLYDSGAPTLAPLYDLVSTTSYERLTTRLAMSINGARTIGEVDEKAWSTLAAEVGLGDRFQRATRLELAERTESAASDLFLETGAHAEEVVGGVLTGVLERCAQLTQEASR
jgi:serine/threonine-protein kinase HipA